MLRGMALTWGEGRRLKRIAATAGEVTFAYDSDGKRVRKTSGGIETKYYYSGNTLSGLVRKAAKDAGTTGTGTTVQFVYDTQGKPFMLRMNGKTDYFYLYNGLGDITGLVDSSNQVVVRYQYNSWGKVTSTQDTSGVSLATLNPFCYRKYVYDPETGLYCLGSRYYDPEVGRFVNADDFETLTYQMDSVQGKNLYQYCFNNPVIYEDVVGKWPKLSSVFAAVAAVAAVVTVGAICVATAGAAIAVGSVLSSAAMGVTSTVTETAITVAAAKTAVSAATTAVVAGAVTEYSKLPRNHTVYKLVDNKNTVQYVGRTVNPDKRKQEHAKNPARANLQFEIIRTGLNRYEARGLEQIMMLHYHTLNTLNAMNNQINGISPKNRKLRRYMYAARGIAKYVDNQITDEILYWNCK